MCVRQVYIYYVRARAYALDRYVYIMTREVDCCVVE